MQHSHSTGLIAGLARLGYAARGLVYLVIAYFAVRAAFSGAQTKGSRSALSEIAGGPLGEVLIWVVAIGLVGYAVWRLIQALLDADNHGTDPHGLVIRASLAASALVHGALALWAFSTLLSIGGGDQGQGDWSTRVMQADWGRWLIAAIGLGMIGTGIAHFVKAAKERFCRYLEAAEAQMRWIKPVSQAGLSARGVTFLLVGGFFLIGAWRYDPQHIKGLGEALQALERAPWGSLMLAVVGVGLLAFAIYSFVEAAYRRVDP